MKNNKINVLKVDSINHKKEVSFIEIEWIERPFKGLTVYPFCKENKIPPSAYYLLPWSSGLYLSDIGELTTINEKNQTSFIKLGQDIKLQYMDKALGIPKDIVNRTAFAGVLQFSLIQWVARDFQARELLYNNPVLLWMMLKWIGSNDQKSIPGGIIFDLIRYRQHNILRALYGFGCKAQIKLLRKIKIEKLDDDEYKSLVYFIKHKTSDLRIIQAMQHWNIIPSSILTLLHQYFIKGAEFSPYIKIFNLSPEILTNQKNYIINEIHRHSPSRVYYEVYNLLFNLLKDSLKMSINISIERHKKTKSILSQVKTFSQVKDIHDKLVDEYNNKKKHENSVDTFVHPPPVPGNKYIIPINSISGLIREGKHMHHCVGSYVDYVQSGQCWIYRILKPERATLELIPRQNSTIQEQKIYISRVNKIVTASKYYKIGQLNGFCNQPVSLTVQQAVYKWLEETQLE